jgi:hypothetical protein
MLDDRRSETGPAICGTGAHTVMAWRGSGPDKHIWYSGLEPVPGSTPPLGAYRWKPQQGTNFQTSTFPTLTRVGTRTFMFYKARDYDFIRWAELRDGAAGWTNPDSGHPDEAEDLEWLLVQEGVAATEHRGKLFVAFVERDTTAISVIWLGDDNEFHFVSMLDDQRTRNVPALTSDGTNLYLAWRAVDDYALAWSMLTDSGWTPTNTFGDRGTRTGPALGQAGGRKLVMVWPGVDGDTRLWWSEFENGQWGGQQPFADRQMNGNFRINLA